MVNGEARVRSLTLFGGWVGRWPTPERSNGRSHQFDYLMLSQQASFSRSAVDPDEKILSHGRRTRQHAVHVFSGRDSSTVLRERLLKSLS